MPEERRKKSIISGERRWGGNLKPKAAHQKLSAGKAILSSDRGGGRGGESVGRKRITSIRVLFSRGKSSRSGGFRGGILNGLPPPAQTTAASLPAFPAHSHLHSTRVSIQLEGRAYTRRPGASSRAREKPQSAPQRRRYISPLTPAPRKHQPEPPPQTPALKAANVPPYYPSRLPHPSREGLAAGGRPPLPSLGTGGGAGAPATQPVQLATAQRGLGQRSLLRRGNTRPQEAQPRGLQPSEGTPRRGSEKAWPRQIVHERRRPA